MAKKVVKKLRDLSAKEQKKFLDTRNLVFELEEPDEISLSEIEEEEVEEEHQELDIPNDPVRLYLREIGRVELLDVNSEFRLATMVEAQRFVTSSRCQLVQGDTSVERNTYRLIVKDLLSFGKFCRKAWLRIK